jgi:hypothetical protein
VPIDSTLIMLLLATININNELMSPVRLKKILVSCYMDREQLDRLKSLSDKTGAPMTHYLREGVALVLDKYAEKKTKGRKTKS